MQAHLEIEHWEGPQTRRERVPSPSVAGLRDRLAILDGDKVDAVWVEIDCVGSLSVGGGPDRFVVVSFPTDGSSSHIEVDNPQEERVELQVGGQTGIYAGTMVLNREEAFSIAEQFLISGKYDPTLKWVQDCPPEEQ